MYMSTPGYFGSTGKADTPCCQQQNTPALDTTLNMLQQGMSLAGNNKMKKIPQAKPPSTVAAKHKHGTATLHYTGSNALLSWGPPPCSS
jgi:hypothetical protein